MSKRCDSLFHTLALLAFALGLIHFSSSVSFSAATYTIHDTAEVTLAWDPNDPTPEGYRIYQRADGQSYDYSQPCWTGPGTLGTVYNLDWDTTYYFVVRAFAGALESEDSEEVSFTAPLPDPMSYTITASVGEHGTLSPDGKVIVPKDIDQTFTIIPDNGYRVLDVKVDGLSTGVVSSYTFSKVTNDHTIEAVFSVDTYQIIASSGSNGSISPSGTLSVDHGTSNTFTVSPASGYHVADVMVDGVSKGAIDTYTFDKIFSDHTIHASFAADPVPPKNMPGTIGAKEIEFADVQIDHSWKRINFNKTFVNPVVVAGPIGLNSGDPSVIRIQNVDSEGFEMRIQKWDYLSGSSIAETVSYLVMEQGNYILDDGTKIEVGNIETIAAASFKQINFNDRFNVAPVVMTTVTSFNDSNALTGRIKRITADGFQYRMQEQEGSVQNHGAESLSYIAWEPSTGEVEGVSYIVEKTVDAVTHNDYSIFFDAPFVSAPTFLADMQTADGGDTANVRYANKDEFAVDVLIDEEQSRDIETGHTKEVVGYMAFSRKLTDMSEAMEFGDAQVNHAWTRIDFNGSFVNPVVVAGPIGLNGNDPAVVRIQNVDGTGFEMRIQEWDYLDGSHVAETVNYLVMEQGSYTLADGTKIEAANLQTAAASGFQHVAFNQVFNVPPIVMTTVTSSNDSNAVTGRMRQITIDGFSYRMQEQEGNIQDHGTENVSYIAWEPSSGAVGDITYLVEKTPDAVTHNNYTVLFEKPFSSPPAFLADMQTADGGDTANVRCSGNDGVSVDVLIDEEQAKDAEVNHVSEVVGYMLFSR